jgi:hypothetical protein
MLAPDHHDWPKLAADELMLGSDELWAAMCAEWADLVSDEAIDELITSISGALAP